MTIFHSAVEPLSKYSPVTLHLSPATRILNENPVFSTSSGNQQKLLSSYHRNTGYSQQIILRCENNNYYSSFTSMSTAFSCKFSIKVRASVPGDGRQVNTTVFLGSSAHLMNSSREKPHVRSATDARTTFGSEILARSAKLWHN